MVVLRFKNYGTLVITLIASIHKEQVRLRVPYFNDPDAEEHVVDVEWQMPAGRDTIASYFEVTQLGSRDNLRVSQ